MKGLAGGLLLACFSYPFLVCFLHFAALVSYRWFGFLRLLFYQIIILFASIVGCFDWV